MSLKSVTLLYFAILRQDRGESSETIQTAAETCGDLYAELKSRHGFRLPQEKVKASVNGAYVPWRHPIEDGDTVVFIPPVAGG